MPPVPASDHASPIRESISESRFSSLRGVRWRIDLGILPKSPASIDDIRRVAADSRRRYAHLRRRLIVDPHLSKDESKSPDLIVDNPLSQSPGEVYLSHVRDEYEDCFSDEFHGVSLPEIELSSAYRFEKIMNMNTAATDKDGSVQEKSAKVTSLDELDPETKDIFLMSDAYGVEGELDKVPRISATEESLCLEIEAETDYVEEHPDQDVIVKGLDVAEESRFNADNSLSTATSPHRMVNDHEYDSEDSSITSSSLIGRTCDEANSAENPCNTSIDKDENSIASSRSGQGPYSVEKHAAGLKKWKPLSGRFQWLRRFNRGYAEGNMGNRIAVEPQKSYVVADNCGSISGAPASDPCHNSYEVSRNIEDEDKNVIGTSGDPCHSSFEAHGEIEDEDKNVAGNLRGIAKAMLENIQVIESIFKQDQGLDGSKDSKSTTISGDGQAAAMAALEELRNISNFLSACDD
ncbi:RabGAP TBC domain-containing protein [Musa troglodytarum]|uniref:RabGAP TBC domain-containing protein n=1 Tax=Musa troglodytarum TaxID=320322 RepID=A0A9E7HHF3_9LILI|nr:RabGAP TBC domain-containing protein [Musa troglodytarum]URE30043.1 RabGAP TBC domain-containing protein [Musa troglodytarum]